MKQSSRDQIFVVDDPFYAEQWPLAPIDDHLIHQTPDPIRIVWTSDARVYERYWATCHDDVGELLLTLGGSFYPSLDTAEAFAIVNYQGQHTTVRAFRRLGADRMNLHIGPIKPTIMRGLRTWHHVLDENDFGISYDFYWHDTKRQVYRGAGQGFGFGEGAPAYAGGRQLNVNTGFEGFGSAEGWVKIGNERIELTRDRYHGTRDRHWGVRDGVGGPPPDYAARGRRVGPVGAGGGQWVEFDDWALWGNRIFYGFGDPRRGAGRVVKIDRRLRFEPDTNIFVEGIITNTLASGEVKRFHYKRLNHQITFLRCGMYDGTPDKNIWQGMYVGDNVVEGETYDVTKPEVRAHVRGNDVHHCLVTCDDRMVTGVFEPHEPGAYEYCRQGRPGWGLLE